ncbi:patatin-like phospholipase family protein, partial [Paucibacter sp. XJ19-41]|uniref:patatin-like phospholipase family protein n=1 Tax=Paucibacter sp. XJ19-41 TaxID=2927824 RepID=UPI00234A7D80
RGAAHIGVLEVLEQLRVPVDCVAGTSMGALVAGAYAAGLSPAAMRAEIGKADWPDMFDDDPVYQDRNFRNKHLLKRFLAGTELGVTPEGLQYIPGVLSGEKIKLFFNQLVHDDAGVRDMQALPLPVSIIATDIGSGERVVFREGSLSKAMRASMSVPGLMAPVDHQGRRLVDGGLVDNVPVREVRERCGAEVVIAINVGSPLQKAADVGSLLSVSAQMVGILTQQNVNESLASLKAADILIKPDLDGITAADFERNAETADRGRQAALAMSERLRRLSVSEAQYAAWWGHIRSERGEPPQVDAIELAGEQRLDPGVVLRHLRQQAGQPLDAQALRRDLLRIYGDAHYKGVDYELVPLRGRNILRVLPQEKSWGPDYLRFALGLSSTLRRGSSYSLRGAYQKTLVNRLGAEFVATAELGSQTGLGLDFYQPLEPGQRFFVEAGARSFSSYSSLYDFDAKISEYRVGTRSIELAAGANIGLIGQLKLGWQYNRKKYELDTGLPIFDPKGQSYPGWFASLDFDQLNHPYFPTQGWALRLHYFDANRRSVDDFSRVMAELRGATTVANTILVARASYTGSPRGTLPYYEAAGLGGLLNMSAFAVGQLQGDDVRFAQLRAERIVSRLPLGLNGDLRVGLALEAGKVGLRYSETRRTGWLDSVALYAGGETPIGPVYIGYGRSSSGASNAYLFIGSP